MHPMVSIIRPREFAAFPPQWLRPEDRDLPPRIHLQIGGHRFGTHVPVLARAKGCIRLRGGMMIERVAQEWEFLIRTIHHHVFANVRECATGVVGEGPRRGGYNGHPNPE